MCSFLSSLNILCSQYCLFCLYTFSKPNISLSSCASCVVIQTYHCRLLNVTRLLFRLLTWMFSWPLIYSYITLQLRNTKNSLMSKMSFFLLQVQQFKCLHSPRSAGYIKLATQLTFLHLGGQRPVAAHWWLLRDM
jgi:hypothetical protein